MIENIAVLGSTGSIGTQTLEVIQEHKNHLRVLGLSAGSNVRLLMQQIQGTIPEMVSVAGKKDAMLLRSVFPYFTPIYFGEEGNNLIAQYSKLDRVVIATPGLPGIKPTIEAIKAKKTICLATKEVLVAAGDIVTNLARENDVKILPIDSEHSAIFQCLEGHNTSEVSKIYLTCSGGPFRGMSRNKLKKVNVSDALNHPNWKMGKKITIDSATLMNKGFEAIEAHWLFGVPMDKIHVILHPQSVIHSAVEFLDGSIIAQMGPPDMRLPIQYALTFPENRRENKFKRFSFDDYPTMSFGKPDFETFRCLQLAFESMKRGGTYPAVLNGANDITVEAFLGNSLPFYKIPEVIEKTLDKHISIDNPNLEDIFEADSWARNQAKEFIRVCRNP